MTTLHRVMWSLCLTTCPDVPSQSLFRTVFVSACKTCAANAESPAGSKDCFCKAGYGQVPTAITICQACVAGTYSEGRCVNKDKGVSGWDGICARLESLPDLDLGAWACTFAIKSQGMPPDMCCVCMEAFEEQCTACPAGTFSDIAAASTCSQCEPGKYSTTEGSNDVSNCKDCAANAESPAGSKDESSCFCKAGHGRVSDSIGEPRNAAHNC